VSGCGRDDALRAQDFCFVSNSELAIAFCACLSWEKHSCFGCLVLTVAADCGSETENSVKIQTAKWNETGCSVASLS